MKNSLRFALMLLVTIATVLVFTCSAYATETLTSDVLCLNLHLAKDEGFTSYTGSIDLSYEGNFMTITSDLASDTDITSWFSGLPSGMSVKYKGLRATDTYSPIIDFELSGDISSVESREYHVTAKFHQEN